MTIRLTNSLTRRKEDFRPIDPSNVRMYVCGPTVYDRAHLGNARPVVVFDVLYRLLRHVYGADHVTYVRNFTDVDDKINDEALRRQLAGAPGSLVELIRERTEETIAWYHADMDALGALRPNHEPRATEYIHEMKDMIGELVRKEFAYVVPATIGHNSRAQYVYLDSNRVPSHTFLSVEEFSKQDVGYRYGEVSGRSLDDMIVGSRAEVGEGKRNPMDSVLWKPSTIEQPGWESPWGFGRPGWHIECSAMSRKLLGRQFDIHGGGLDLLFPHHENEVAQCRACDGHESSARYWLHNEMLLVEGKKMSKSLGNFFTVRDLLDKGVPGEVIRLVMLMTHYRSPMDWTEEKASQAFKTIQKWKGMAAVAGLASLPVQPGNLIPGVLQALSDDLNTPSALTAIFEFESKHLRGTVDPFDAVMLDQTLRLLGFDFPAWRNLRLDPENEKAYQGYLGRERVARLIDAARSSKNFSEADRIRDAIRAAGFDVSVTKEGATVSETLSSDYSALESIK